MKETIYFAGRELAAINVGDPAYWYGSTTIIVSKFGYAWSIIWGPMCS